MRSIKFSLSGKSTTGWDAAVRLTTTYLTSDRKADQLLNELPEDFIGDRRATCQSFFLGALRHGHRTQVALKKLMRKKAKPAVEAILLVAGYEILDTPSERHPKVIHHAVERSKRLVNRFEQGFLNAVLRKLPHALNAIDSDRAPAAFYSHPQWLVTHWQKEFPQAYRALLQWNQTRPSTYLKLDSPDVHLPTAFEKTDWPHFYRIGKQTSWKTDVYPLLNKGTAYIKDPSTRLAPALLAAQANETVLDLCAAPGGKAYEMAHAMEGKGQIVAVDLPGNRMQRLEANLSTLRSQNLQCSLLAADLLTLDTTTFSEKDLPTSYTAVMLDAPCSNTGVIQRRTDVKWRLQPADIKKCAQQQLELLQAAATFVQPGGRLVYSTCSIESAENQAVVDAFLQTALGKAFHLEKSIISLPWESGHDGAGAFRLRRRQS